MASEKEIKKAFAGFVLDYMNKDRSTFTKANMIKWFKKESLYGSELYEIDSVNLWNPGLINIAFKYKGKKYTVSWSWE
jgi:hypothetical protein